MPASAAQTRLKTSLSGRFLHLQATSTCAVVPAPNISATAAAASACQCPLVAPLAVPCHAPAACLPCTELTEPLCGEGVAQRAGVRLCYILEQGTQPTGDGGVASSSEKTPATGEDGRASGRHRCTAAVRGCLHTLGVCDTEKLVSAEAVP
jgi:hypothetical protein